MFCRRAIRIFSQYQNPQKYYDFKKPSVSTPKDDLSLDTLNKKALTFRKVEIQDYDFVTEESDFDTSRFSFKSYLYTCVFYTEKTFTIFAGFLLSWMIFSFCSRVLFFVLQNFINKFSTIGYFGLAQPAYRDIELERKKQRIKFSVLHSYD